MRIFAEDDNQAQHDDRRENDNGYHESPQRMVLKTARRIVIAVIGGTVALIGLLMFVGPGPGIVVFPAGLAILGTEFAWARWLLTRMREKTQSMMATVRNAAGPKREGTHARELPQSRVDTSLHAE